MGRPSISIKRCLLCRHEASPYSPMPSSPRQKSVSKMKSCATSLCKIFGLPVAHPFKVIYERAQYCEPCMKEVHEMDETLEKLELMKQSLIRLQNKVYSKLGDNYFQIGNRDTLNVSFVDFESGGEAMKGRKFSYDEIVKVVYEKLNRDCLKWERFSSVQCTLESSLDSCSSSSMRISPSKTDSATQTENIDGVVTTLLRQQMKTRVMPTVEVENPKVQIPDINDDAWGVDADHGDCEAVEDDFAGGDVSDREEPVCEDVSSSVVAPSDPLGPSLADLVPPEASHLFIKSKPNFDVKICCTFDPENCKRFFYDTYNLGVHVRSFHEGNALPHECSTCKKGCIDEVGLKNHILRVHSKSGSFICDQCGKGFACSRFLQDHVRKQHVKGVGKSTHSACCFCSASFPTSMELQDHEDKHRSLAVPFGCVYCSEVFPNNSTLKRHYSRHHNQKSFTCDICGNMLSNENSLKKHILTHSNTFKCEQCEFRGGSQHDLRNHMVAHSEEKLYTCESCGRSFKHAKNLNSHKRIHTGEKPCKCSICGMCFRESSFLKRHEESHSSTMNYQCVECGALFKVKENLRKHQRRHKANYVPKKKLRKPRTDEQKLVRRQKNQQKRLEAGKRVYNNTSMAHPSRKGRKGQALKSAMKSKSAQNKSPRKSIRNKKVKQEPDSDEEEVERAIPVEIGDMKYKEPKLTAVGELEHVVAPALNILQLTAIADPFSSQS